ncbi:hypothetical protein AIOL_000402 [Candidatus Rhodobacter oscarellae]|uniref:Uncharacterized protein n=1 Tax=Candidatus Rhodobacter oscarellae TaxID=1675527 RepID=A0A0J9EEZ0_9RHOB|nr:hypothetical protein [Candidatus Rhodobacter lobularis]KMW60249.1 hypothetical protein AIOL_000402 [Candidatus Rhodobacter lobularis]
MSACNHFETILRISDLVKTIEAEGMKLTVGTDFSTYRNLRSAQFEQRPLYPMFDIQCSFIDASNSFWIAGTNAAGELVHTQAILKLDMSNTSLDEHLTVHRQKYLTPGLIGDADQAYFSVPGSAGNITGEVCYHGEFWLQGGEEGFRKQGFTALLSRLTFELAYTTWNPDYIFGLVPATIAQKGIGVRYGYFHGEPGIWRSVDERILSEEWVVWMSNHDIARLTQRKPDKLATRPAAHFNGQSIITHLAVGNLSPRSELTG